MSSNTELLKNMAQNLTDEIGSGIQHTKQVSNSLAINIAKIFDTRRLETIINKIPIYIIIAHSALEVNYSMPDFPNPGKEEVCIDGEHGCFFTSNDGKNGDKIPLSNGIPNWLENEARFVYYPTPPGEAGGLRTCPEDENDGHILRNNMRNIKASILSGSNFLETLRDNGRSAYGTEKTIASAFLPESFIPDKKHQFFGDRLSFGGFGIIKLYNTGQNLDKSIVDIVNRNFHILNNDGFFYASNTSERTPEWIKDIAYRSEYENQIPMSEIVRKGGAGFYISLSCSVLSSIVYPNCNSVVRGNTGFPLQLLPMPIDEHDKTVSLHTDIAQFHDTVIDQFDRNMHENNVLWQAFFKKILPHPVSRGKQTLELTAFGDFSGEGYGASTRRQRNQRKKSASVARTRGIISRNEYLVGNTEYLQYTSKFLKKPKSGLRQRGKSKTGFRRRKIPQPRSQQQEQEPSACKSNATNAACILAATAVGTKLGGIEGACVGAACGAAVVGYKRMKKKKEKKNGGRRKKTKKRRRKKGKSRRRKRTRKTQKTRRKRRK
jgi:hypothetical protein